MCCRYIFPCPYLYAKNLSRPLVIHHKDPCMKLQWTFLARYPTNSLTLQYITQKQVQRKDLKGSGHSFGDEVPATEVNKELVTRPDVQETNSDSL